MTATGVFASASSSARNESDSSSARCRSSRSRHSPFALPAYRQLEESYVLAYGGASSVHLPAYVWTTLRELRALMGREKAVDPTIDYEALGSPPTTR